MAINTKVASAPDLPSPASVLLVVNDARRADTILSGLPSNADVIRIDASFDGAVVGDDDEFDAISKASADIVIVDCGNPSVNAMDRLGEALAICPRPIVMFVEDDDEALAREAVRIGVSEYVVRGLAQERVQPLVKIAIERFRLVQSLHDEVRQLKADLEARKVIERAKGVLMARRGFAEAEAFDAMRRLAMQQGKPLRDVAAYVLVIANTLDDGNSDSLELMRDLATGQDKSVVEIANDIVAVSVLLGEGDERRD